MIIFDYQEKVKEYSDVFLRRCPDSFHYCCFWKKPQKSSNWDKPCKHTQGQNQIKQTEQFQP